MVIHPFEDDWSLFCKKPPTSKVGKTYQVGSVSFKMVPIPGQSYSYMETLVTQELYQEVMGNNPSHFKSNPQNPVECVSWEDAMEFCVRLSRKTGEYFCLPTEDEWEFSALGGLFSFADFFPIEDYAVVNAKSTAPVKSKLPNPFGLYDMLGNVMEWTDSLEQGGLHVVRGGSWYFGKGIYSNLWYDVSYSASVSHIGFRCVEDT